MKFVLVIGRNFCEVLSKNDTLLGRRLVDSGY